MPGEASTLHPRYRQLARQEAPLGCQPSFPIVELAANAVDRVLESL